VELLEKKPVRGSAALRLPSDAVDAPSRSNPGRLGWWCYSLQAAGLLLYIIPIWLEVYIDTRRAREVAVDALSESHRHWRVRTTLMFLIWSILGGFTLPFGVGWLILIPAFVWYALRIAYGALRFARGLPVGRYAYQAPSARSKQRG